MKDEVIPEGKWKFDNSVAEVFDDMLERSIPQYDVMRDVVYAMATRFCPPIRGTVVDLGCSRGGAIARLAEEVPEASFIGVEVSKPMREAAEKRFHNYSNVTILDMDLRESFPKNFSNVTMSVLCAMFVPIEYRQRLFRNVYTHLTPGGAFLLVEKVLGGSAKLDDVMTETYLCRKRTMGYTEEQIARKRLSLEGVLVPVTARMNEEFLWGAGFRWVECFWRWMNFAGWIGVKE